MYNRFYSQEIIILKKWELTAKGLHNQKCKNFASKVTDCEDSGIINQFFIVNFFHFVSHTIATLFG